LGHSLTLVSAPAGFGKTTIVVEWLGGLGETNSTDPTPTYPTAGRQTAWLSLDENDNDLARFLTYVVAALNQLAGGAISIGKGALGMLHSPQPPPAEEVLIALINDIAVMAEGIILVLDDYHVIDSPSVNQALAFLLDHVPSQLHVVIATREDPGLPLARLRARGLLTEVRAAHLRFSPSEAADFLNHVMGLNLSPEEIDALESRTEGWIAGLQLAALALQGKRAGPGGKNAAAFIDSFSGSHHFVLDYLIEEVIEQQPENIQAFLLQTAALDRLNGSLCDALTNQGNGRETLQRLERTNLFIIGLDDERLWYRYHHLFADLLRRRLHQKHPDWLPELNQKASEWNERNGFAAEAIEYALRAKNYARAARVLEGQLDAFWGSGKHRELQRWLSALPEEVIFSRPHLAVFQARYQCNNGQVDAAERTLAAAEQALSASAKGTQDGQPDEQHAITATDRVKLQGRVAATRALMSSYQGDVPGIIQNAHQALGLLPDDDLTWRSVTALTLGNAHGFMGDMIGAYEARYEALQSCQAAGDVYFITIAYLQLAITLREQGRLQQTVAICQQQYEFAVENGLSQTTVAGWLLAVWGETLAEMNDLDGAVKRAEEGFALAEHGRDLQMLGWSFMCLVRTLFSRGDLAEAEKIIRQMESRGRESQIPPWIASQMAGWQARIWLAQNNLEAATRWAIERGLDTGAEVRPLQQVTFFSLFDYLVLARVLIAQERLPEVASLLQLLLKAAEAGGRTSRAVEILILQALVLRSQDEDGRALSALKHALTLAEPEGFVRIFADEGGPAARLLQEALDRGIVPGYARRLLAAFPGGEPADDEAKSLPTGQVGLIEPLSERELEVLQHVAAGLTNREIAARLYLSLNTIKVHTRNIYGKLGVNSRTQAVARSRELGILDLS
jgi:LuxR family maltose regulon positive regulatory protein